MAYLGFTVKEIMPFRFQMYKHHVYKYFNLGIRERVYLDSVYGGPYFNNRTIPISRPN